MIKIVYTNQFNASDMYQQNLMPQNCWQKKTQYNVLFNLQNKIAKFLKSQNDIS
jgi:hypothetical protein